MYKKALLTLFMLIAFSVLIVEFDPIQAQNMSNDDFILELNPTKIKVSPSLTLKKSDDIEAKPTLTPSPSKLSFTVENSLINYGQIQPGEPIIRSISVTAQGSSGFEVLASENSELQTEDGQVIPDVTCDQGNCSELVGASWTSPLTYGFGYNCKSVYLICEADFIDQTIYKQLPNTYLKEFSYPILNQPNTITSEAEFSFKVNIPPSLADKSFTNEVYFIALPLLIENR